jgi:hypothetical protein
MQANKLGFRITSSGIFWKHYSQTDTQVPSVILHYEVELN